MQHPPMPPLPSPGVLDTCAILAEPTSMLMREDLPTLERPTMASSGRPSEGHCCSEVALPLMLTDLTCRGLAGGRPGGRSGASSWARLGAEEGATAVARYRCPAAARPAQSVVVFTGDMQRRSRTVPACQPRRLQLVLTWLDRRVVDVYVSAM